jgi:hypothetical protein
MSLGWAGALTQQHRLISQPRSGVVTLEGATPAALAESVEQWQAANPDKMIVRMLNRACPAGRRADVQWRLVE